MPVYYQWSSRKKKGPIRHDYPSFEVSNHPLKSNTISVKQGPSKDFMDNLNKWSSAFVEVDPLLRFEQMNQDEPLDMPEKETDEINYTKAWNTKRSNILHKYTTVEKLTIVSSFLPGGEKALIRQVSTLNEKVKHRLEQLDEFDEASVRKTMGLSQHEFTLKINLLNDEIKKAWGSEQRVKAFKIAIQCSKQLSDTSVVQFYPSKFVLISDTLDMFGDLVFNRLRDKSFGPRQIKNIWDIDHNQVPESAKETCQNWMYKMASIRELLPRMYIEMALLKCNVFISRQDISPAIARLTRMIRGIGNPLVASYLRLYLCRVASKLIGNGGEDHYYENFKEFLDDYQQIYHPSYKQKYESQSLPADKYLSLYLPAIDWLLYGTLNSNKCKATLLEEFLRKCEDMENNELLLYGLLSSFDSINIIKQSSNILELIQKSADRNALLVDLLSSLGAHLCAGCGGAHPPAAAERLAQGWWRLASALPAPAHFLQVLEPWVQFACLNLSSQHVNVILRGTIRYMVKCGTPADEFSGHFQLLFKRMLNHVPDVEELFLMDAFMPLVELVQSTSARTLMAKTVLSVFFARYTAAAVEDPIVISSLMRLCVILHDSINAVTVEDESRVCAELVTRFVQAVSRPDLEQQLNFYVQCRGAFLKLDAVLVALLHAVNSLCVAAGRRGEGAWMARACSAYCYVTAPSLRCPLAKLQLYLLSGQVALLNNCQGQAEANFKALVGLIPDIPEYILEDGQKKPTNVKVAGLLSDFLSTLLILPDNVDTNCKAYILSGFIKTLERIHWRKTDSLYYTTLLHTLDLLCNMTQENYSYHIESVLSNDVLYGCDPEFVEIVEKYSTTICQELLVVLKALGDAEETKRQSSLSLELFWRVVTRADLEQAPMFALATNLWMLLHKNKESHNKLIKSTLSVLDNDLYPARRSLFKKLQESTTAS